jgi:hypothetical protein
MAKQKNILHRYAEITLQYCRLSFKSEVSIRIVDNYGKYRRVDIKVLECTQQFPLGFYIECKWQEASGSAWEKIEKAISDAVEVNDLPTVLLIDGPRAEMQVARERARAKVGEGNLHCAVSLFEFWFLCRELSTELGRTVNPGRGRFESQQKTLF